MDVTIPIAAENAADAGPGIADGAAGLWESAREWLGAQLPGYAATAAACVLILAGFWLLARIVRAAVAKPLRRKGSKVPPLVADFIVKIAGNICWTVGILVCLDQAGVSVGPMIAGLGVAGFIAGFACQDALGNFASGAMLVLNHPFDIGDFVQINGLEGRVTGLTLMATQLVTGDNKQVVIPNKVVWGAPIVNYYNLGVRRVDFRVTVPYGSDVERARATIRKALDSVDCLVKDREPGVNVSALTESGVVIACTPWAASDDYWTALSQCQLRTNEELAAAGFGPPSVYRTVLGTQGGAAAK